MLNASILNEIFFQMVHFTMVLLLMRDRYLDWILCSVTSAKQTHALLCTGRLFKLTDII